MSFAIPKTREELLLALKENPDARLCAGGTDLMIRLREKKEFHYSLIDLTHLPELSEIAEEEDVLRIGAAVTMDAFERSSAVKRWIPALQEAAALVGSTQIRNRATIGGNVANASQSSDLTPVLLAYEAQAAVCDQEGTVRLCPVDELVIGLEKTNLKNREVILWFLVKKSDFLSGFSKVGSRRAVAISKVNGCVKARVEDGRLKDVCVVLGAVGPKGRRSPLIEQALEGMPLEFLEEEVSRKAVYDQIEAHIPDRSSRHYKKSAACGVLFDMLEELLKQYKKREKGGK